MIQETDTRLRGLEGHRGLQMDVEIKDNERIDDLQRNGYQIIQNPEKFCFGMDAVLLAGFVRVKLVEAKTQAAQICAVEIQEESADMARRSVRLNGLESKIDIVTGDLREADKLFDAASFDVVTCNPPYMIGQHGLANPDTPKAIARHEILCTLEDVVRTAARLLRPGGCFCMVHRPFRLAEIITVMTQYRLEPKRMKLVYPYVDREPNMVLIEGCRGGRPRMTVEKPLIVFREQNVYTDEICDVYGY